MTIQSRKILVHLAINNSPPSLITDENLPFEKLTLSLQVFFLQSIFDPFFIQIKFNDSNLNFDHTEKTQSPPTTRVVRKLLR